MLSQVSLIVIIDKRLEKTIPLTELNGSYKDQTRKFQLTGSFEDNESYVLGKWVSRFDFRNRSDPRRKYR